MHDQREGREVKQHVYLVLRYVELNTGQRTPNILFRGWQNVPVPAESDVAGLGFAPASFVRTFTRVRGKSKCSPILSGGSASSAQPPNTLPSRAAAGVPFSTALNPAIGLRPHHLARRPPAASHRPALAAALSLPGMRQPGREKGRDVCASRPPCERDAAADRQERAPPGGRGRDGEAPRTGARRLPLSTTRGRRQPAAGRWQRQAGADAGEHSGAGAAGLDGQQRAAPRPLRAPRDRAVTDVLVQRRGPSAATRPG